MIEYPFTCNILKLTGMEMEWVAWAGSRVWFSCREKLDWQEVEREREMKRDRESADSNYAKYQQTFFLKCKNKYRAYQNLCPLKTIAYVYVYAKIII